MKRINKRILKLLHGLINWHVTNEKESKLLKSTHNNASITKHEMRMSIKASNEIKQKLRTFKYPIRDQNERYTLSVKKMWRASYSLFFSHRVPDKIRNADKIRNDHKNEQVRCKERCCCLLVLSG